jgi:hypothetical protein
MKRTAMLVVLSLLALPLSAQTWTGSGADSNWSTAANWTPVGAPASSTSTQLTFGTSPRFSPVVDAPWTINRLTISATYSFTGQPLTFAGTTPLVSFAGGFPTIANPIMLTGATDFSGFTTLRLTGVVSGTGPLVLSGGTGGTIFMAANTFTGGVTVATGHGLVLEGGSIIGPVTVTTVSRLAGGGTVNGTVTVTTSGAGIYLNPTLGTLRTGDVILLGGDISVDINGPAQGTQYGHLDVTGTVNLGGRPLALRGSFVPVAGTVFTIVTNDGTEPIVGTFAGLPEGATVTFNGVPLTISYVGGTGNDIALTATGAPVGGFTPVPTLSEWALLALALLVLAMGAGGMRRRA